MLSDERDLVRTRDGVRRLLELAAHPDVVTIADDLRIDEQVAVLADLPQGADLDAWLLARCGTICHPAGTCRMGAVEDPRSVVDSDCRVIGVDGLRVVDSSVMPTVVRANNHLSCVMVAEHVFERIKPTAGGDVGRDSGA
jgi:5-(hydroxymethyl)furfural/furfural oxidase